MLFLYCFNSFEIVSASMTMSSANVNTNPICFSWIFTIWRGLAIFFILAISIKFSTSFGMSPYLSVISSITSIISASVLQFAMSWYISIFWLEFSIYVSGINDDIPISIWTSISSITFSPFSSFTTSFNSLLYISYPTCSICPDWTSPKILPAPLICKSLVAILNPEPNSVNSFIAFNLWLASYVIILSFL